MKQDRGLALSLVGAQLVEEEEVEEEGEEEVVGGFAQVTQRMCVLRSGG